MRFYKIIIDTLMCIAALATGASAVVALVHYLRHWRDDEVKIVAEVYCRKAYVDRNGCDCLFVAVTISNVGKVPVTVTGFEFVDKSLEKDFNISCIPSLEVFLYQGTTGKARASIHANERGVSIPSNVAVRCKWAAERKNCDGSFIV